MTPNLLDELEKIVALSEKATPGPWERGSGAGNEPATMVYCDDALGSAVANCHLEYTVAISGDRELGNAAFIAAAVNFLRTHAPALADMAKRMEAAERKYGELIFSVASKFPGESRHETALRYIRNAETAAAGECQAAIDAAQEGEG